MIEIFYIIAQILFILAIACFPIILFENNVYFNSLKFNLLDKLSINLIFFMNLLFLTSILNINTYNILYIYFFTCFYHIGLRQAQPGNKILMMVLA